MDIGICVLENEKVSYVNIACKDYFRENGLNGVSISKICEHIKKLPNSESHIIAQKEIFSFHIPNSDYIKPMIYEEVLNNLEEGIAISDAENRLIFLNKSASEMEGLSPETAINKKMTDLYTPTENAPVKKQHIEVLTAGISTNEYYNQYIVNENQRTLNVLEKMIPIKIKTQSIAVASIIKNLDVINNSIDDSIELLSKAKESKKSNGTKYTFENLIGNDISFISAVSRAKTMAKTDANILLYGETGVGKELFAQSIHNSSHFQNGQFVSVNCAAIPKSLLERIFFGTKKGVYTGVTENKGLFEQADGGTIFLDEIGSMDISLQSKILKVIESKSVRRLGDEEEIKLNCRVICTINKDPVECITDGSLRKDLYYRLSSGVISIPPLRERKSDIAVLSNYFIKKYNKIYSRTIKAVSKEVLDGFNKYPWEGNIRELEHSIESAYISLEENIDSLRIKNISPYYRRIFDSLNTVTLNNEAKQFSFDKTKSLKMHIDEIERELIFNLLKENNNNISLTASQLKITRQALQHKLKKYK